MAKDVTTIGHLLLRQVLPDDIYNPSLQLDKKGLAEVLRQVGERYPDKYREISHKLANIGHKAALETGGNSFGLEHMALSPIAKKRRAEIQLKLNKILDDDNLSDDDREQQIIDISLATAKLQEKEIYDEQILAKNPLAMQLKGAGRGSPTNLMSLLGSDMVYTDTVGKAIPLAVLRNYSEGMDPASYFAGAYGARKGVVDTKRATADAGYFSKRLNQAAHRLLVTALDRDEDDDVMRGYPVDTDDTDNEGALLAHAIGGYDRNTPLNPKILRDLKAKGHDRILVRSPILAGPPDGGVYARDVGIREKGGLPGMHEMVGLAASQSLSEPMAQGMLCLARGTMVALPDGTGRAIESLIAGDSVVAFDVQNGVVTMAKVTALHYNGYRHCNLYDFSDDYSYDHQEDENYSFDSVADVVCTPDHKFVSGYGNYNEDSVIPIKDTDCVLAAPNSSVTSWYKARTTDMGLLETFDITIDHDDHLFVLANGLIVSNSSKHAGGVATAAAGAVTGGFAGVNALVQFPKAFPHGAAHSQLDGFVQKIEKAPAGGHFITINGEDHYVPQEMPIKVKRGDRVEAGDVLSDGVPNPAEITRHKGIGEGRKYLVHALREAYRSSNVKAHRRNLELVARGLINHVEMTGEAADAVPGDIVPYDWIEKNWQPREGHRSMNPRDAVNKYLERPVLHYSIGTKVKPSMLKEFQGFGVNSIDIHDEPPPFEPRPVRSSDNLRYDRDWMTRMFGAGLEKGLLESARRGNVSDPAGTSFVPSLAQATTFGDIGQVRPVGPITKIPPVLGPVGG